MAQARQRTQRPKTRLVPRRCGLAKAGGAPMLEVEAGRIQNSHGADICGDTDVQADKAKAEKKVDPVEAELKKYSIITSNPWEPEKP
jgi:hypothetical protein